MAIDARVESVHLNENGGGRLNLIDRPGKPPGIAGQRTLNFDKSPEEVTALNGLNIWGGSDFIMLGQIEIAKRDSYTHIVFHDAETFKLAVAAYHKTGEEPRHA
jgi:hypothetical protein